MNAPLSILLNKSIFYNKKIAILFFISLSLLVFVTFFDKGFEISRGNFFLISTLYFGISISLYWLIKEKNYEFHKYSFNIDEYRLSSKKDKEKSYNEVYNKLLSEELKNINSNTSKKIDEFLSNVQNELNKNLRKLITFERFDDYFTRSKKDKTTSRLFYFQYKKSLIKIIKDFIVNTNELEDISNEIISRFIFELTNYKNLHFEKDLGLHYHDKFAFEFLEKEKLSLIRRKKYSDINQNNITKDLFREGILKIQNQISQSNNLLINNIKEVIDYLKNNVTKELFIKENSKIQNQISQSSNLLINNIKEVIDYLKNNVTKELFIKENSKIQNQISQSNNLLINNKKEVIDYLKNNVTKELFIKENQKTKLLISSFNKQSQKNDIEILSILKKYEDKIEQENIIEELKKNIKPIKINKISKYQFYKVLEKISIDVLKVKLTEENIEELKSFVGIFFICDTKCKLQYQPQVKELSFINLDNSTDFILSIKYLITSKIITNNVSGNMQNLDKVIAKNAYNTIAENRAEIFRINLNLTNFAPEKQKNIDFILQELKIN